MSFPQLKRKTVNIAGLSEPITVTEMSAKCYVELLDSRNKGRSETETSAVVVAQCVPEWKGKTADDLLENCPVSIITDIMQEVIHLSESEAGNFEADPVESLSSN